MKIEVRCQKCGKITYLLNEYYEGDVVEEKYYCNDCNKIQIRVGVK